MAPSLGGSSYEKAATSASTSVDSCDTGKGGASAATCTSSTTTEDAREEGAARGPRREGGGANAWQGGAVRESRETAATAEATLMAGCIGAENQRSTRTERLRAEEARRAPEGKRTGRRPSFFREAGAWPPRASADRPGASLPHPRAGEARASLDRRRQEVSCRTTADDSARR